MSKNFQQKKRKIQQRERIIRGENRKRDRKTEKQTEMKRGKERERERMGKKRRLVTSCAHTLHV